MERKKTTMVIIFAIFGLASISGGIYLGVWNHANSTYVDPIQVSGIYSISKQEINADHLQLILNINNLDIKIFPLPKESPKCFYAEWNFNYTGLVAQKRLSIDFLTETTSESINISLKDFNVKILDEIEFTISKFNIYINPYLSSYSFLCETNTTKIKAHFFNMTFDSFKISNQVANTWVNFTDCQLIDGANIFSQAGRIYTEMTYGRIDNDMTIISHEKDISTDFWNVKTAPYAKINFSAPKSVVYLKWMQHTRLDHTINISAFSLLSSEADIWIPLNICNYRLNLYGETGHRLVGKNLDLYTNISQHHIEYLNPYLGADWLNLNFTSHIGDLRVHINPCFKPLRYCGSHPNLGLPVEHVINGTVNFHTSDLEKLKFDTAQLEIRNYLPNVEFNIKTFIPEMDDAKIVESAWNLSYYTGSGLGYGDIKVKVNFTIEESKIVMEIFCNFAFDKILPYFPQQKFDIMINSDLDWTLLDLSPKIYAPYPDI